MKKITFIFVSLCVIATLFSAVSCIDGTITDTTVGFEETRSPEETQNIDSTVAEDTEEVIEEVTVEDTEDDVYISISPSAEGQEWGDLNISGN